MAYLSQRGMSGLGDQPHRGFIESGRWDWEFYPPPYDFLAPRNSAPQLPPVLGGWQWPGQRPAGLAGCHCGGACGGHGCGVGVFESGMDLSGWSWPEFAIVGGALYLGLSLFFDARSVGRRVGRSRRASQSKARRREQLQKQLAAL